MALKEFLEQNGVSYQQSSHQAPAQQAPKQTGALNSFLENPSWKPAQAKPVKPTIAKPATPKKEETTFWKKAADKTKSWFNAPTEDTSQTVEKNPFTGKAKVTGFTAAQQKEYDDIISQIEYWEGVKGYATTVEQADEIQAQIDALSEEASGMRQSVGLPDKSFTASERLGDWGSAWGNQFGSAYAGAAGNISEMYANRYDVGTDENTYKALSPEQQAEYDRLMAERDRLEQSRAYVTTTEQSDELEAAFKANTEALQAIAPTDQSKAEALYAKSDELNQEYQKDWNKATYGQSDAEIFLMQAGHQGLNIAADSLATIATIPLGGWGGKVSMAGRIYGQTASEARRQGDDVYTAAKKGLTSAVIETLSEMIGGGFDKVYGKSLTSGALEKITRNPKVADAVKKFLGNPIVKGGIEALGEGAEEGLASVMQLAADHMFGWSKSGNTFMEDVKANGGDMVYEMLLGTFVGVFGASGQIAIDSVREADAIAAFAKVYGGSAEDIIQQGLDSEAGSKAYRMALDNQEKLAQNGKISDADLYKQFKANVEQIKVEGGDEKIWTPESTQPSVEATDAYFQRVMAKEAADNAGWAELMATDGGTEQATVAADVPNTEQPETPTAESPKVETPKAAKPTKSKALHESYADVESDNSSIESYAAKYEGRAGDVQQAYAEGQDVAEFGKAFDAAYRMGESMLPKTSLGKVQNLSDEQKQIAFQMGRDAAGERATTRALNLVGKGAGGRGVVSGEGISLADVRKKFNDAQNTAYRVLDKFARATGVNIVLYSSDESGNREEGSFSWKDDTIRININSGVFSSGDVKDLSKYTALRTFSHELTHFTEKWNAEQYDSLREFVFEALDEKGVDVDERIQLRMAAGLSYDMASREVVADSMADMLGQSDIFERLAKKDANMAQSLLNKLKEFVARLKQAFQGMTTQNNYEAEVLKDSIGYSEELVKKWTDVLEGGIEAYNAQIKAKAGDDAENLVQSSRENLNSDLKPDYVSGSLEERIDVALRMKAAGKQPAEIYSKTGLVMMANGKLQDGFGGTTVWEGKGNEKLGQNVQNSSASKGRRQIETEISKNDRRGVVPALRGEGEQFRNWEELSNSERDRIKQLILSRASKNSEVDDLRELFSNDEEMTQFFYEKFLEMPAEEFERAYVTIVHRNSVVDIVSTEGITQSNDVEQNARGRATLSDRELLEAAAARLPREGLSESEKLALVDFQKKLDKLKELQEQRVEQGRIYKEQMFTKGGNRAEAQKTKNRMDILDKKINSLENTILSMKDRDVFKKILKSARDMIEREARASEKKTLAEYRAKRNESEGQKKYRDRIIKTARELMAWISTPSAKEGKRVPLELQEALSGLLSSIDFTSKRALRGGDATKRDIDFKNRLQAVKDALDRNIEAVGAESGYVDIRPEFSEEYKALVAKVDSLIGEGEDYVINRMNAEDLKKLSELLKEVKHYVQNANVLHENEVFKTAHEAGDESIQSMGKLGKASKGTGLAGRFFNWFYMRPAYVFSRFGKGGESIYQEFRKAQGLQARLAKEVLEFSEKTFTPEMAQRWAETTRTFNIGGEKVKIPISHIMSMYCLSKREQGLLHLLGGGFRVSNFKNGKETVTDVGHKITREKLDEILATLDQFPAAKKIADELQNYMSTVCAAWGNEVDMVRFGVPKFLEKNYFPINSDGRQLAATTDEAPMEVSLYALLNAGFTKNLRIGANNRLIVYNIFDVFANHATSMVQYRSFALPVLDTLKWFNHKNGQGVTVRDAMAKAFGSKGDEKGSGSKSYAEDFVINLLRDYNGARRGNGSGVENALLKGLSNINRVRVSYNLSTMLLQPTAIARAGMFLKGSKIIRGLGMAAKDYKSLAAEMEKHSGIALWKSLGFYDVNISRGIAEQIKQDMDWKQKLNDMGMKGAEAADRFTWAAIWAASKMSVNRAKYRTEAEYFEAVNDVFEEVIYKTQVVDSVLTKAEAQREKGFAAKSVMSFMSEAVASTSLLSNAAMQYDLDSRQMGKAKAWQKNRKHIGRAIKVWTVSKVLSAAVSALVAAWRDDDDYEDSEEKYFSALKEKLLDELNPLGDLPVLGDVISILQGYSDSSELGQIVNYFTSAYGIIMDKLDKDDDGDYEKYTWWGAMYKVLQGASAILGAPFATMSREAVDLWNNTAGRLKPEWKLHTYDPGVQNSIKYAYDDGYIGREEAIKLLIENAEESEMSATFTVDEWVMQRETGIRYGDMQKAYVSGELTDEQVRDYLVRYGHDLPKDAAEKQLQWKMEIDTGIMYSSLKNAYIDGEVSERDALDYLKKYGGLSQEDAEAKVLNWEGESEYGINIGSSTMGIKAALLNDFITAAEAKHIMMTYDGKTEQEAEVYTNQYLFTKETGYNFSDIGQAYADGVVSLDEMAEWYEKAYIHSYGEPEEAKMYAEVEEWKATVPGAEGFNKTLLEKWKNYGYNTTEAGLSKSDFAWASAIFQDTSGTDTMEKGEVFYQELYNRYLRGEISLWQLEALARSFYSSRYYKRYKFW